MSDPWRSTLFAEHQDLALVEAAREYSFVHADFEYLMRLMADDDPERAWEAYCASTQPGLRTVLDGLLGTFPPEERNKALELAGSVEVFCLPSPSKKSISFPVPDEPGKYLIGVALLPVQLSTDVAWGMSTVHPYYPEGMPRDYDPAAGRELLDIQIAQYVRAVEDPQGGPLPRSLTHMALEVRRDWPTGQAPRDYSEAAMVFAVAHELAHIEHGDLFPDERQRGSFLLPPEMAAQLKVSNTMNEELAADASTFMPCFNLKLGSWVFTRARELHKVAYKREKLQVALHSAHRATEACQAYYTAVGLLGMMAWRRGEEKEAEALLDTAFRGPLVQLWVQQARKERMVPELGPLLWTERDVAYRKAHDKWRLHCVETVLPRVWAKLGLDVPDTFPDLIVSEMYSPDRLAAAAVSAGGDADGAADRAEAADPEPSPGPVSEGGKFARHTAALHRLEKLVGLDHPQVLNFRRANADLRGEEGDPAGAVTACDKVVADLTRVQGADHHNTLNARNSLASWLGQAGHPNAAAAAYATLALDAARALGPDHLLALAARYSAAAWQGAAGDAVGAVARLAALLPDYERVLGADHPVTLRARNDLAGWRAQAEGPPHSS
ncbi:hypothetical protein ACFYSH_30945 [Streptomyces sp. NPDC005791]|uniref:hypothetical protein n=1 Tax=Streptomyces sp. NPDC005791 TaxID=3364732 RepID=UPI0036AC08D8